jgi:hypothetical protein
MVGHHVTQQGVVLDPAIGTLDAEPAKPSVKLSPRMRFANEPKMDMWLMYACPYTPNGRIYNCKARAADARESGTTFVANERTLTQEDGLTQASDNNEAAFGCALTGSWPEHCSVRSPRTTLSVARQS